MNNVASAVPAQLLLSSEEWLVVKEILHHHLPNQPVWAFGSRVGGPCKPFSDLDLVVLADKPLPLALQAQLHEAFSESVLPWKVDLIDWSSTSEAFRQRIAARHVVVQ